MLFLAIRNAVLIYGCCLAGVIMLGLILVQTVCQGYQQVSKAATSGEKRCVVLSAFC